MDFNEELKKIIAEAKEQANSKDYQIQEMRSLATKLSNCLIRMYDNRIQMYNTAKSFVEQIKEEKIKYIKDEHDIINFSHTIKSFAEEIKRIERGEETGEDKLPF